ncbi:MAG: DUF3696 domain-containing protein [Ornithinimicrobium sp.]
MDIAPLTVIIGRNNVGKSSLYAPLLMLRQTLDAIQPETALLGRGSLIDVGTYRDYVTDHDTSKSLSLSFSIPNELRLRIAKPARIESIFASADSVSAKLIKQRVFDNDGKAQVSRSRKVEEKAFDISSPMLPKANTLGRPIKEITLLRKSLRDEQPSGFLFSGTGGLYLPLSFREDPKRWEKVRDWYNQTSTLYEFQSHAGFLARRTLMGIHYVGPLRQKALRTYRLTAEPPTTVGPDGQYAAELLFRRREGEIYTTVNRWMNILGYGGLAFEQLGDDFFQASLVNKQNDLSVNIAHTGTGVSQILPILAQGLIAGEDETFITQQPEIHLNPAQQTLVADFLIERCQRGTRVILETHSEHMLLRLRRRIAEGELDSKSVRIYFVEEVSPGRSKFREVDIDHVGNIGRDSWPAGFFGELMDDAFALAIAQARAGKGPQNTPTPGASK